MDIFDEVDKIIRAHELRNAVDNPIITDEDTHDGNVVSIDNVLTPKANEDLLEALGIGEATENVIIAPEFDDTEEKQLELEKSGPLKPRDYQLIGIDWLKTKRRALLTDQAGLGKTLQAAMAADLPALVIAPTYLTQQWYNVLCQQFPDLAAKDQIVWAHGTRMKRIKALKKQAKWTIINIQMLRTFGEYLPTHHYATIIIDESHHIRNRKAQQSKLAAQLCRGINKRVYLLTATPIWKNPDDIWMQLHVLQPKLFPSYAEFVDLFCNVTEDPWQGIKVVGIKRSMTKHLNELLNIVRLGRTYRDVGRVLPPVIHRFVSVDFPEGLRKKYDELRRYWLLQLEDIDDQMVLFSSYAAVLHSLRALTAFDGKISAVIEVLDDIMGGVKPPPAVIYCWYKEHAYKLEKAIRARFAPQGLKVACVTGDVPAPKRPDIAANADIVVATIGAMSEGVNLYNARSVVYFEENWSPGSNYQSLSRVRRDRNDDGQDVEPVQVFYMHVPGTIDVRIHNMSKARQGTITQLIKESLSE